MYLSVFLPVFFYDLHTIQKHIKIQIWIQIQIQIQILTSGYIELTASWPPLPQQDCNLLLQLIAPCRTGQCQPTLTIISGNAFLKKKTFCISSALYLSDLCSVKSILNCNSHLVIASCQTIKQGINTDSGQSISDKFDQFKCKVCHFRT